MNWCEHMDYDYGRSNWPITTHVSWKFCPECGAKRPEKPRTLAEKLLDVAKRRHTVVLTDKLSCGTMDDMAQTAYEHFCEVVDRMCRTSDDSVRSAYPSALKEAMKDSL